jgi:hypothetical protein
MTLPLVDGHGRTPTVYTVCTVYTQIYIQYTYISINFNYLFISKALKCNRLTSIVYGTVHSGRSVVVWNTNTSVSDLALFIILSALSPTVPTLLWASLTLWNMSTIFSHIASQLITSNLSWVLIVFRWFFTWLALSDGDIRFSLTLIRKFNAEEEETTYHQSTESLLGVTMTPISASLLRKLSAAMDHLCQIALNR